MTRAATSPTVQVAARFAAIGIAAVCSAVEAQTWVRPDGNIWNLEEPEWAPSNDMLARAASKLEAAYASPEANQIYGDRKPEWSDYTLFYQGRLRGSSRIIRVIGNCRQNVVFGELVIVTADGGRCNFHATYNADRDEVTSFQFNGIR